MAPMGPMGPMGPMVGGWWAAGWLVLLVVALLLLALGLVALARVDGGARPSAQPLPPEELLRARYARGELTREQYREALVDALKDRYVRGELDLEAYEVRLARLLDEPRAPAPHAAVDAETQRPPSLSGGRPTAPGAG